MSYAVDVVAILDDQFRQVVRSARPMRASVREEKKLMEQPLETGASVIDHAIILPVEIELAVILEAENFISAFDQLRALYINNTLLTVQTKVRSYPSMILAGMPHEETTDQADTITVGLRFKEARFASVEFTEAAPRSAQLQQGNVSNPQNATTKNAGQKLGKDAGAEKAKQGSILYRQFKGA